MEVTSKDFQLFNTWEPDLNGRKFRRSKKPMDIIDKTTGRKYLNESKGTVRLKCFFLALGTPLVHTITSIAVIAFRLLKLATLSHFWMPKPEEKTYSIKNRLNDAGLDLIKIFAQPIGALGAELAAIYGVFKPYDGRKLYASFERAQYGICILAPCFQPDAKQHLFGAPIGKINGW